MLREEMAVRAMCALIEAHNNPFSGNKKIIVDNAIAYADLMIRRLGQIPTDAQERSEKGQIKRNET